MFDNTIFEQSSVNSHKNMNIHDLKSLKIKSWNFCNSSSNYETFLCLCLTLKQDLTSYQRYIYLLFAFYCKVSHHSTICNVYIEWRNIELKIALVKSRKEDI